ncbi:MAG: stage II sporulation protein P [Firmicutes bacterium]|nr:stage II sporulation protein P [Bacillota bacterium]
MKRGNSVGAVVVILCLTAAFLIQEKQEVVARDVAAVTAQRYIEQALPAVNRGSEGQRMERQMKATDDVLLAAAKALTDLSLPAVAVLGRTETKPIVTGEMQENSRWEPEKQGEEEREESQASAEEPVVSVETETAEEKQPKEEQLKEDPASESVPMTDSIGKPVVLIYHTHATESYQPVSEGNFHSLGEEGTVRQVGDVMARRLEELGYEVIHDETIHDHPSYNQSYSRSLETAKSYLGRYPSLVFIVDLHRDAAGYAGSVGKTVTVDGKNAASYGYVVGQGNPNVAQLTDTVTDLNRIAEELYPGFTGKLIEKAYKFNQYISDHHVLIEVGNNENTIEQAKITGRYLADVIAAYLKEQGIS